MKVQTYTATTIKEALRQVRENHGPDAVILETRQKGDGSRSWHEVSLHVLKARVAALAALQWARANGCEWDARTCSGAATGGHLEVLQWARANGCPDPTDRY